MDQIGSDWIRVDLGGWRGFGSALGGRGEHTLLSIPFTHARLQATSALDHFETIFGPFLTISALLCSALFLSGHFCKSAIIARALD